MSLDLFMIKYMFIFCILLTCISNTAFHFCTHIPRSRLRNLKRSQQLQVRTFHLVQRERMKEHLHFQVKGKGRGMPLGVCVHTCMHACTFMSHVLWYTSNRKKAVESDLKHGLKIGWKSEESIVCSLGWSLTIINFLHFINEKIEAQGLC